MAVLVNALLFNHVCNFSLRFRDWGCTLLYRDVCILQNIMCNRLGNLKLGQMVGCSKLSASYAKQSTLFRHVPGVELRGKTHIVINNHRNSRGGKQPPSKGLSNENLVLNWSFKAMLDGRLLRKM